MGAVAQEKRATTAVKVDWIAHSSQLALSLPVAAAQAVDSESASHPTCPTTAGKDLGRLP